MIIYLSYERAIKLKVLETESGMSRGYNSTNQH